jgi:hypothetical protein
MDAGTVVPQDGDVVVVRASSAVDAGVRPTGGDRFAVVEWGTFALAGPSLTDLGHDEARLEARLCASHRGRNAWDTIPARTERIPRLPLVYRGPGGTYSISVDVTDYADARAAIRWKSTSHLSEAEVRRMLAAEGIPPSLADSLIGKAPMPEACA